MTTALALLRRFWPAIPMLALAALLALANHDLSNARKAIGGESDWRTVVQLRTGAKANDHATLYATIEALMREDTDRGTALAQISRDALTDKQRADAADAQLKREQAENDKRFAAAQRQIAALEARKSTGNRDADWQILEQDTQSAWRDWK